jgi:hypothetical protein
MKVKSKVKGKVKVKSRIKSDGEAEPAGLLFLPCDAADSWRSSAGLLSATCLSAASCRAAAGDLHESSTPRLTQSVTGQQRGSRLSLPSFFGGSKKEGGRRATPGQRCRQRCCHPRPAVPHHSFAFLNRNAFTITDTELKLIAAAATVGPNTTPNHGYRMPAAIGTPTAL